MTVREGGGDAFDDVLPLHGEEQQSFFRFRELFQRQLYVDFWYERAGIELRHQIGMNNIMWESDFPHSTSTYPESRKFVDRILEGVPKHERDQLCYGNAMRLYGLN